MKKQYPQKSAPPTAHQSSRKRGIRAWECPTTLDLNDPAWPSLFDERTVFTKNDLPLLQATKRAILETRSEISPALWQTKFGRIAAQLDLVIEQFSMAAQQEAQASSQS
jgi:hypothetical protein